jgi:acyl carrier protein
LRNFIESAAGIRPVNDADIYVKLTPIFHSVFDDEDIVVTPQLTADDVNGWDSLTHIRLMLSVQKAFNVRFAAADIVGLKNVEDLVRLIREKA